jgi:hypothetical protein
VKYTAEDWWEDREVEVRVDRERSQTPVTLAVKRPNDVSSLGLSWTEALEMHRALGEFIAEHERSDADS